MAYSLRSQADVDLEFSASEFTGALQVIRLRFCRCSWRWGRRRASRFPTSSSASASFRSSGASTTDCPLGRADEGAGRPGDRRGALTYAELAAAGLLAGGVLLAVGQLGLVGRLQRVVGEPVIRGVQFAVALLLLEAAVDLSIGNPPVAAGGLAVVGLLALGGYRRASVLVVLGLGGVVAVATAGVPTPTVPTPQSFPPGRRRSARRRSRGPSPNSA